MNKSVLKYLLFKYLRFDKYNEVCEANEALRNELVSVKAQNEAKSNQIMRLEEELKSRNIESEDIYKKIEAVLGR